MGLDKSSLIEGWVKRESIDLGPNKMLLENFISYKNLLGPRERRA